MLSPKSTPWYPQEVVTYLKNLSDEHKDTVNSIPDTYKDKWEKFLPKRIQEDIDAMTEINNLPETYEIFAQYYMKDWTRTLSNILQESKALKEINDLDPKYQTIAYKAMNNHAFTPSAAIARVGMHKGMEKKPHIKELFDLFNGPWGGLPDELALKYAGQNRNNLPAEEKKARMKTHN